MTKNAYPSEMAARIDALRTIAMPTEQQLRILKILDDPVIQKKSHHVFKTLDATPAAEKEAQQLGDFWSFIEAAAAVLDEQPYGSRLRDGGEAEFPFRNDELCDELSSALHHATKLKTRIQRIAPSISQTISVRKAREFIADLDQLIEACSEQCFRLTARCNGVSVFPDSSPQAKKNNWHAWVIRRLATLAEIHLGDRFLAFIIEVHRILLGLDDAINMSTAKRNVGIKQTRLIAG